MSKRTCKGINGTVWMTGIYSRLFSQRAIAHNRNRNHFLDKGFDYDNLKLP
jgi:hypothetical protein